MDSTSYKRERLINQRAYEALRDQIRRLHGGKYVAIAEGRLLGVADSFEGALDSVRALDPTPEHFFVFGVDDEEAPLDPILSY